MIVYIVALIELTAYLAAVPLSAGLRVDGQRVRVALAVFGVPVRARFPRKRGGMRPKAALRLLTGLRLDSVDLSGSLGLGDAAATALACGMLNALGGALPAKRASARVRPDFGPAPRLSLRGEARLRAGQLAIAAARSALRGGKGRIHPWKSTRLKAS